MLEISVHKPLHGSAGEMTLDVDLRIENNSFVSISGVSGSGKTTLLRILAGLEKARGRIKMNDNIWLNDNTNIPPQDRGIGFVFQSYALFPNMTVQEHLLFVNYDLILAKELMKITDIYNLKDRMPDMLSGGQKQRVSLCRAMMRQPKLLLLDEPFSALDPKMRISLQHEILQLHRSFGCTTIMASHNPAEIYMMAKRVIVLDNGTIVSDGSPMQILLTSPKSQKFYLEGKILDIVSTNTTSVAVVAIEQQIIKVTLEKEDTNKFTIGDKIRLASKVLT